MPELPEVQTVVNHLIPVLPGLTIRDIWTDTPKLVKSHPNFPNFKKAVIGKKVLRVERKAKNILINLSGGQTLAVHQKMTGHLLYGFWERKDGKWLSPTKGAIRDDPHNRFIRVIFYLSNSKMLALCDMRKFAKIILVETAKINSHKDFSSLGPDALDKNLTLKKFSAIIKSKKGKIKQILLDQTVLSGIGNIYADESLYEASIHPMERPENISPAKMSALYKAIRKILTLAIKHGGSSDVDFRNPKGERGQYQEKHKAYRLQGEKCSRRDGGTITRIHVGGRGTHYCPVHQKLRKTKQII